MDKGMLCRYIYTHSSAQYTTKFLELDLDDQSTVQAETDVLGEGGSVRNDPGTPAFDSPGQQTFCSFGTDPPAARAHQDAPDHIDAHYPCYIYEDLKPLDLLLVWGDPYRLTHICADNTFADLSEFRSGVSVG